MKKFKNIVYEWYPGKTSILTGQTAGSRVEIVCRGWHGIHQH